MTPAERDDVRAIADAIGRGCYGFDDAEARRWLQLLARAVMRYVPAGDVPVSLLSARATAPQVVTFDGGICTAHSARRIAAEFHAAADAAEES